MQGHRFYLDGGATSPIRPEPGDYWYSEEAKAWMCRVPNGLYCNLKLHQVIQHDDGTITVSPAILVTSLATAWHGSLERGMWREVEVTVHHTLPEEAIAA